MMAAAWASNAGAATEEEKLAAIRSGLDYLTTTQLADGPGAHLGYNQAATGAGVFAFLSQKDKWDPADAAQYQQVVDRGMAYLLATATKITVDVRSDGLNPCSPDTTCPGVYWQGVNEPTHTGLVAPAIALYGAADPTAVATTTGPLANMTWRQIAQGITNLFAHGQTTRSASYLRGGWRYYPNQNDSDMSTTQWAVIALIYDQTLGATTPQFVKDELRYWLTVVQYPSLPRATGAERGLPALHDVQPLRHRGTARVARVRW